MRDVSQCIEIIIIDNSSVNLRSNYVDKIFSSDYAFFFYIRTYIHTHVHLTHWIYQPVKLLYFNRFYTNVYFKCHLIFFHRIKRKNIYLFDLNK